MLVLMSSAEVKAKFDFVLASVLSVLKNRDEKTADRISKMLLSRGLQSWAYIEDDRVVGLLTTSIVEEPVLGEKNLVVFSLTGFNAKPTHFRDAWDKLEEFARENGCSRIAAYTVNRKIMNLVVRFGGSAEYFLYFNVGGKDESLHKSSSGHELNGDSRE